MNGIIMDRFTESLIGAGIFMCILIPLLLMIVIIHWLIIGRKTKENCVDCVYKYPNEDNTRIYCKCLIPMIYRGGERPYAFLKKDNNLYSSADRGLKVLPEKCKVWKWDGKWRNLKKNAGQLITK